MPNHRCLHALIVSDSAETACAIKEIWTQTPQKTFSADTAELLAFVAKPASQDFDLTIVAPTDVEGFLGSEFCRALFQENASIVVLPNSSPKLVEKFSSLGASDVLYRENLCSATLERAAIAGIERGKFLAQQLKERIKNREKRLFIEQRRRHVLELVGRGSDLKKTLAALCQAVKLSLGDPACAIRILEFSGRELKYGAGSGVDSSLEEALASESMEDGVSPCALACVMGKRIVIQDGQSDPRALGVRETLEKFNIRASVSQPIFALNGSVLGTIALYYDMPRVPSSETISELESAANLASIAIERFRSEGSLRKSESQYRQLVETSNDLIWSVDEQGCWTFVNKKAAEHIYGLSPEEMIGKPFTQFVAPARLQGDLQAFRSILDGGSVFDYETEHLRKDGTKRTLRFNAVTQRNSAGEVIGTTGTASDVTDRKSTEVALRASEVKFRTLAENVPGVIYVCRNDEHYSMSYLNDAVETLTGYPKERFLSGELSFVDLYHPDDATWIVPVVEAAIEKREPFFITYRLQHASGEWRWVEERGVGVFDGKRLLHLEGFLGDVTERKKAEDALRDSTMRYRTLTESSPVGVWHLSLDSTTLYLNPVMCRLLEVNSSADLEGCSYRDFFKAKYLGRVESERAKRFLGITSSFETEIVGRRGTPRSVMITGAPVYGSDGALQSILGIVSDTTEIKHAEKERMHLERKMQHAQKLESLGVLAGGIAHDFNNLLMGVMGHAGLAEMELPEGSPVKKRIEQVRFAAQRAAELTNQLLAYSGKGKFSVDDLNLSEAVREIGGLLETVISKKATVDYQLEQQLPAIAADASQIRQILMNLITNASDAIGDVAGHITIRTGVVAIDSDAMLETVLEDELPPGDYAFVEVDDTGQGMSAETIRNIFDPFFTTKFTGRGLGLAAVLGIVRSHRGTMQVKSKEGVGTTFRVLFPVSAEKSNSLIPSGLRDVSGWKGSGLIVVVDDEATVREVAQTILERYGFEVLCASQGREALELFEENQERIVALVLDLTMPEMSGVEVYGEIRQQCRRVPIILSSGYSEEEAFVGAEVPGRFTFVQKPYEPETLVSKVREVLEASAREFEVQSIANG